MARTNQDSLYLAQLRDYYAEHQLFPSYEGICKVVGFKAKTASRKLGQRLTDAGYLRTEAGGKLVPTTRFFELSLADFAVRAGVPDAIEGQGSADLITLDSFLITEPSKTVLIRVKGDSMRDAGIFDGDLAIVKRTRIADSGQFVVAIIDGEMTLKELAFENKNPILVAHNALYPPIRPKSQLEIFGTVHGIVRKLQMNPTSKRSSHQ